MANKDYDLLEKLDGKGICAAVAKYDENGKKLVGTKVTDAEIRNGKLIITKSEEASIEFSGETNVIEAITLNGQPQEPTDKTVNLQVNEVPVPDAPNKVLMSGEQGEYHWENAAEAPGDGELSIKVGSSSPVKFTANQSTNQEVNIPEAASATAQEDAHGGLMTKSDKKKLDEINLEITPGTGDDSDKVNIQLKNNLSANVLTTHQDVSGKADKSEMAISSVSGDETKKKITLKQGFEQEVVIAHQDVSGKAEKSEMSVTDVTGDNTKKSIQLKDGLSQVVVVAHQDISGKEDNSNKVSAWSETTTDEHYPSEKLTKDSLDTKANKSEMAVTTNGDQTTITLKEGTSVTVINAHQDISGKAEKSEMDITAVSGDNTKKKITLKAGLSQDVVVEHQNISGKADKVNPATSGNFAGLDANGNLTDSGKKKEDFASAAQGGKADSAIQGVKLNGSTVTPDSAKVVDLGNLKTKQTAVSDPQPVGEGLTFIDQTAQDENGVLTTLTKKTVQSASTSQKGVVQLQDSIAYDESSTTTAPTPRAVRDAISNAVASAYHHAGTKVVADLTSSLLVAENEGCVYNMTDAGTTTADFIEGAGKPIRIGDNVGVCKASSSPDAYKFDLLSGFVDLSNYKTKQTPVSNPSPDGSGISFIDSVSQNENGELDAHSKNIQDGNTSQKGIVQLTDAVNSTSVTTAATPNSVKQAYDLADSAVKGVQKNGTDIVLDQNKKANVIVNNSELKIKLGSANAVGTGFTADADEDVTFEIPRASFDDTQTPTTYTDGLMSGEEKEKLDGIANGAEVNSIESITIEGDQNPLPISSENITIPKAAYTTGANPSYTTGAITGQDKKKLDDIEAGAQVNDIEHIRIGGESSDLTIDASKRIELPLAASATTSPVAPATSGIMSASDKDKLDHIAPNANVNVIEGVKLAGESNALTPDANKVVTIPEAAVDSSGSTPAYSHGLMSASDKEKLDSIAQGAQVNVKPDWEAASGAPDEILNKPTIPTVNNSTISMKIEDDSAAFDSFSTNAASGKTIEIPLATAPAGASQGNSGAITAADKAKLNKLTTSQLHMLKFVQASPEDPAPYGAWVLDLDKPNAQSPNGYDFAMYADIKAGLEAGTVYGLSTQSSAPGGDEDVMIMSTSQLQGNVAHPGVRLDFYSMYASYPYTLHTTSIYTPSIYNNNANTQYPEGRMGLLSHNGGAVLQEFNLTTRGVPSADSGDAGKFLGVDSGGDYTWQLVEHVPGVTSSDNGKVLKATYNSTTGVGSYEWDSDSGETNVIEGVKLAGAASVLTPDVSKNVTIPNAVATGETGATNGLMTAADKKKLGNIEAGADVNAIESISVSSVSLTPDASKNVNIPLGTDLIYDSTNGIQVNTTGTATGTNAFAEGIGTTASGNYAHAEGYQTSALGTASHAEGYNTTANGNGAHAEGADTDAIEQGSHAGGYGAHTTGLGNFIHGTFLTYDSGTTKAQVSNLPTVVLGTLNATVAQNLSDHGGYLIIVGNGDYTSGGSGTRRDGFILYKDGTVKARAFQNANGTDNDVSYGGTSGVAFSGITNIEVFDANTVDTSSFPNDSVLRIILE